MNLMKKMTNDSYSISANRQRKLLERRKRNRFKMTKLVVLIKFLLDFSIVYEGL